MALRGRLYPPARNKLEKLDHAAYVRYLKALGRLEREELRFRHLKHGLPFFVGEAGGERIVFEEDKEKKTRSVLFIGKHKEYEEWYSSV